MPLVASLRYRPAYALMALLQLAVWVEGFGMGLDAHLSEMATGGSTCTDDAGFEDAYGTCKDYASKKWCTDGEVGPSWMEAWGPLGDKPADGCCACGGGSEEQTAAGLKLDVDCSAATFKALAAQFTTACCKPGKCMMINGDMFPNTCPIDCAAQYVPGLYAKCRQTLKALIVKRSGDGKQYAAYHFNTKCLTVDFNTLKAKFDRVNSLGRKGCKTGTAGGKGKGAPSSSRRQMQKGISRDDTGKRIMLRKINNKCPVKTSTGTPAPTPNNKCAGALDSVCAGWATGGQKPCNTCALANLPKIHAACKWADAQATCRTSKKNAFVPPALLPPVPPHDSLPGALRPHIILFIVDDMGWSNIGYHNPAHVHTPNMDADATENGIILDRHYSFKWCGPSRASLMTGRQPYHVAEQVNYVDGGMTMLPAKLKQVGYYSVQVGKWHLGQAYNWMTPHGRGFDESLGYLGGDEGHYSQRQDRAVEVGCTGVDLWETDRPAYGQNGTYGAYIYTGKSVEVISRYRTSAQQDMPLFMYIALQDMHAPNEVPERFSDLYPSPQYSSEYAVYNGMASCSDESYGNISAALRKSGMWENTLLVMASDNGGPAGASASGHAGNNYPFRGGKQNNFEGGIRVNAFVTGGAVPLAMRGKRLSENYIHLADWYATFAHLAGVDPSDNRAAARGVPGIDSLNMWPYLSGSAAASPRTEIVVSAQRKTGGIISGAWKLIVGVQTYGFWQAPVYPNASTTWPTGRHKKDENFDCGAACLFNLQDDPAEHHNLALTRPDKVKELKAIWALRMATYFKPNRVVSDKAACVAYTKTHGDFLGPYHDPNAWPVAGHA